MTEKIFTDKIKIQIDNHIHPLSGIFDFDNNKLYDINNIKMIKGEHNIKLFFCNKNEVSDNIKKEIIDIIKKDTNSLSYHLKCSTIIDFHEEYDGKNIDNFILEVYINTNDFKYKLDKYESKLKALSGGAIICSPHIADRQLTSAVPIYSEPVITIVKRKIVVSFGDYLLEYYEKIVTNHPNIIISDNVNNNYIVNNISDLLRYTEPPNAAGVHINIPRINKITFLNNNVISKLIQLNIDNHGAYTSSFAYVSGNTILDKSYEIGILKHHIRHHYLAHLGFNDINDDNTVQTHAKQYLEEIGMDNHQKLIGYHLLHSYLHILDGLRIANPHAIKPEIPTKDNSFWMTLLTNLQNMRARMRINVSCVENILKYNEDAMFQKTDTHILCRPYRLIASAIPEKVRQYKKIEIENILIDFRNYNHDGNNIGTNNSGIYNADAAYAGLIGTYPIGPQQNCPRDASGRCPLPNDALIPAP